MTSELRKAPHMLAMLVVLIILFGTALLIPVAFQVDPNHEILMLRLTPPSWHIGSQTVLGMDDLGRPMWIRLIYGLRTSFVVGLVGVATALVIGTFAGLLGGYFGGILDGFISRILEIQLSVPPLLLVLALAAIVRPGPPELGIFIGLMSWMMFTRVTRSVALTLKQREFVLGAQALGARHFRILFSHVLPNCMPAITATATLVFADVMLAEAGLSFLGFGIQPPSVSLGAMLSDGQNFIETQWWLAVFPGVLLAGTILMCNLTASWLRSISDPTRS